MAAMMAGSILFGLLGGMVADRIGTARATVIGGVARGGVIAATLLVAAIHPGASRIGALIVVAFLYSAASQVYCPAEVSLVRTIEGRRPSAGHAMLTVLQYVGQGGALAISAALAWRFQSPWALVVGAALAYIGVVVLMQAVASGTRSSTPRTSSRHFFLRETVSFFRNQPGAIFAGVLLAFGELTAKAGAVALPYYFAKDLGLSREASLLVVGPGVLGVGLGLYWAGRWLEAERAHHILRLTLLGTVVALLALGVLPGGLTAVESWLRPDTSVTINSSVILAIVVTVPVALLLGLCFAVGPVAARALLSATAPRDQQSRVFAMQSTVTDSLGIVPLVLSGVGAQLAGGRATFVFLGLLGLAVLVAVEASGIHGAASQRSHRSLARLSPNGRE
jgi:MFS family permease